MQHPELTAERRAELVKLVEATLTVTATGGDTMRFQDALTPGVVLAYEAALTAKEEEALKLTKALEEADDCLIAVDGHTLEPDLAEGWGTAELYDAHMIIRAALSPETSKTDGER